MPSPKQRKIASSGGSVGNGAATSPRSEQPQTTPTSPRKATAGKKSASAAAATSASTSPSPKSASVASAFTITGSPTRPRDASVTRASPYIRELDFVDMLYQPHTVMGGIILLSAMLFVGRWYTSTSEFDKVVTGVIAAAWTFIVFGALHLPDGILVRPHPVIWRGVLACGVLYMVLMVFLVFQDITTLRKVLIFIDPALATMPPQQSYAADCRITTPEEPYKFFVTAFDEFILAHLVGYWMKMVVLRDWRIVTMLSVGFELIEVSLQHVLPNFAECWWDHLLLDIFLCNACGTFLGWLTLRHLEAKQFNWAKLSDIPGIKGKAGRVLRQLGPRRFDHFEWHPFDSFRRFCQMSLLMAVMFMQDVNCFTLKHMLHMQTTHPLVLGRLTLWAFMAAPSLREFYDYISDPACKRVGTNAWVGAVALLFETLFSYKIMVEGGYFPEPAPSYIALPWIAATGIFLVWVTLYFGTALRFAAAGRLLLNALLLCCSLVLLAMCLMGNKDTRWFQGEFEELAKRWGLWV